MKKYFNIIMLMLFVVVMSGTVNAYDPDLYFYWNFTTLTDLIQGNELTNSGASSVSGAGNYPSYSVSGDSSPNSFDFELSEGDYLYKTSSFTGSWNKTAFTFSVWIKPESLAESDIGYLFFLNKGANDQNRIRCYLRDAEDNIGCDIRKDDSGWTNKTTINSITQATWNHFVFTCDSSLVTQRQKIYINGVLEATGNDDDCMAHHDENSDFYVSKHALTSSSYFDGLIDELRFYNISLSATEVDELWKFGNRNLTPPSPAQDYLNISDTLPANNYRTNSASVNFNLTYNASALVNCTFLWNGAIDQNVTGKPIGNNLNINFTKNFGLTEASYTWQINCTANTTNEISTLKTIYVDRVSPSITVNPSNIFNTSNKTTQHNYIRYIPFNFTFTDNLDLYGVEVLVRNAGGSLLYNYTNISIGVSSVNLTETFDSLLYGASLWTFNLTASDQHTVSTIGEYKTKATSNKLTYDTEEGNRITIESEYAISANTYKTKQDRYNFEFDYPEEFRNLLFFKVKKEELVYHIKSDRNIVYLPDSRYKGHFIVWNGKEKKGNWIDFESPDYDKVKVEKVNDRHYIVRIDIKDKDPANVRKAVFNSIGGLNVRNVAYEWYHGTYEHDYSQMAATFNTYPFEVTLTTDATHIHNISGRFFWNDSELPVTITVNPTTTVLRANKYIGNASIGIYNWTWNITELTSDLTEYNFTFSGTQNVTAIGLEKCGASSLPCLLNFSVWNEDRPIEALDADWEMDILYGSAITGTVFEFATSDTSESEFGLASFTPNTTIYLDLYLKYTTDDGFTHRYYLYNYTMDANHTATINLYNFNTTTGVSDLVVTCRNKETYAYYPEVVSKLQRYYVGEGLWRTVQMDQSTEYGELSYNIEEKTNDYRILFYDIDNNFLAQTTSMKFICSLSRCDLIYLLEPYESSSVSSDVDVWYTFTNATGRVTIYYSNPTGQNITLRTQVGYEYAWGSWHPICDYTNSTTSLSGSIICDVGSFFGVIDIKVDDITTGTANPIRKIYDAVDRSAAKLFERVGEQEGAFWAFAIGLTAIGFGLFSPIAAMVAVFLGIVVVMFLGISSTINFSMIVALGVIGIALGLMMRRY